MKPILAELMLGIGTALISMLMVTSAIMMSLGEILPAPVASIAPTASPTPALAVETSEATFTTTPTINPSLVPHAACTAPKGWQTYIIKVGDTVEKLAAVYGVTVDQIKRYNCMKNPSLPPNTELFLPPLPTSTATLTLVPATITPTLKPTRTNTAPPEITDTPPGYCSLPSGWKPYRVHSGETLSSIGAQYNISYLTLLDANCLPRNHRLIAGETIYVPNTIPNTPRVTKTNTPEPEIPTEVPPTLTPRPTNTPRPATPIPSNTIAPTKTPTLSNTSVPTNTPAPSNTSLPPTNTPAPSNTSVANTPTPALPTPVPTFTPMVTP
jgi:LysM repeat protein